MLEYMRALGYHKYSYYVNFFVIRRDIVDKVEKRRAFLINFAFVAVILALAFVALKYFFWVAAPFLLSFFFVHCIIFPYYLPYLPLFQRLYFHVLFLNI